jgi:hypothetical protein
MRAAEPPMLVWTRLRTVWSVNDPVTRSALAPQVTTWSTSGTAEALPPGAASSPTLSSAAAPMIEERRTLRTEREDSDMRGLLCWPGASSRRAGRGGCLAVVSSVVLVGAGGAVSRRVPVEDRPTGTG